jgi:hypothetical protein
MADKTSFAREEWTLLLQSPVIASMAVTAADPSGLWGMLKESLAGGGALARATTDANANALVKAVAADFATSEGRSAARDGVKARIGGGTAAEVKARCVEALRQISTLLDGKAPGDAIAFKTWLRQISQHTAEAATEGGFAGLGGVPVSEAETATLGEINGALKLAS